MRRLRTASAAVLTSALLGLCAGCGASRAPDPLNLIVAGLTQQYFDAHHAFPSTQEQNLLGRQARGLLARVLAMPAPRAAPRPPQVDTAAIHAAHGAAAVDQALLAAYIIHFRALPGAYAQSQIATLAGTATDGPLPVAHGAP